MTIYDEQTIADLNAARGQLLQGGWCQGRAYDDDGRMCAVGAIRAAIGTLGLEWVNLSDIMIDAIESREVRAVTALHAVIGREEWPSIPSWNDYTERRAVEVIQAFEQAAQHVKGVLADASKEAAIHV